MEKTNILFDTEIIKQETKYFLTVVQGEKLSDEELRVECNVNIHDRFNEFEYKYKDYFDNHTLVAKVIECNFRYRKKYVVFDYFNSLVELLNECDYISIYEWNGDLFMDLDYRNSSIRYMFKEVNKQGLTWYADNWNRTDIPVLEKVWNRYIKKVRLSKHGKNSKNTLNSIVK